MTIQDQDQQQQRRAQNRADFLRRLFAVIVSVGFATQLVQMDSVKNGRIPTGADLVHLVFLAVGLVLIIQSWEEYFSTIEVMPLTKPIRFYIDITILFSYLLLLMYSSSVLQFLLIVSAIFVLYWLWETFVYVEYPTHYAPRTGSGESAENPYWNGIIYSASDINSPLRLALSTILALVYFLMLYFICLDARHATWAPALLKNPYFYAILVLLGLIGYRIDQSNPQCFKVAAIPAAAGILGFLCVNLLL